MEDEEKDDGASDECRLPNEEKSLSAKPWANTGEEERENTYCW